MCAQPNLDDAEACLARARKRCAELNELTHPGARPVIVVKLVVAGLEDGLPNVVNTILDGSFRFVRGVIDSVAGTGAGEDGQRA